MSIATRTRGTQDGIVNAIVKRLRDRIVDFNEATCFVSDQVIPSVFPPGRISCTVCLGPGVFPESFFAGAGHATVMKQTTVRVSPFVRVNLEKLPETTLSIVGSEHGLVSRYERHILTALLCEERDGVIEAWEPCDSQGRAILRNQLSPASTSPPAPTPDGQYMGLTIDFNVEFDWQLV